MLGVAQAASRLELVALMRPRINVVEEMFHEALERIARAFVRQPPEKVLGVSLNS